VTEQKAGYITADTLESKVLICILAEEVRRNCSAIRAVMSAVGKVQFAAAVARRKTLVRLFHQVQGQVGKVSRINSKKRHESASLKIDES